MKFLLLLIIVSSAAFAVHARDVKKATKILASGMDDAAYLPAVKTIIASELKEEKKHEILLRLFTDADRMAKFDHLTGTGRNTVDCCWESFKLVTTKLSDPLAFFHKLAASPTYNLSKDVESLYMVRSFFVSGIGLLKEPDGKLLEKLLPVCQASSELGIKQFEIMARHADNKLFVGAISTPEKWSKTERMGFVPLALATQRTRLAVFAFLVDEYLRLDFNAFHKWCFLKKEYLTFSPATRSVPDYTNVSGKDAAAFVKQIDRVLAVSDKLLKLKDEKKRWSAKDIARLQEIRALMLKKADAYKMEKK